MADQMLKRQQSWKVNGVLVDANKHQHNGKQGKYCGNEVNQREQPNTNTTTWVISSDPWRIQGHIIRDGEGKCVN